MNIQDRINENFTRENLIDTIAKYQLYYQLALGVFAKETSCDQKETMQKIQELNLDIQPENVLNTMIKIITTFNDEKDFELLFADNIKANAMMHSLDDFIGKSESLPNKDEMYEDYCLKIQNDKFYDINMHVQYEDELKERIKFWEKLISSDVAKDLVQSAHKVI